MYVIVQILLCPHWRLLELIGLSEFSYLDVFDMTAGAACMAPLLLFCKGHCAIKLSINVSLVPESMELELASHNEDAPLALSGPPSLSWLCRAVLSERP